MQQNNSLSNLVENLIEIWSQWMHYHKISNDYTKTTTVRRDAGLMCHNLINKRWDVIYKIDKYFDKKVLHEN